MIQYYEAIAMTSGSHFWILCGPMPSGCGCGSEPVATEQCLDMAETKSGINIQYLRRVVIADAAFSTDQKKFHQVAENLSL